MAVTAAQLDGRRIQTGLRAPADSMTLGASPDVVSPDVIVNPNGAGPIDLKRASTQSTESTQTQETATASLPAPTPFVRVPETEVTPAAYAFDMRGQWEGTVTHVGADDFSVVLRDIFNPGAKEYEAVFSVDEVADDDRDLLKEGAILYWTIGYQQRRGQRLRVSEVRLRRLPAWSRADLARVEKAARELDDLFEP
jgi:hypothetical protein